MHLKAREWLYLNAIGGSLSILSTIFIIGGLFSPQWHKHRFDPKDGSVIVDLVVAPTWMFIGFFLLCLSMLFALILESVKRRSGHNTYEDVYAAMIGEESDDADV